MDGTFGFVFAGPTGFGAGVFVIKGGSLNGSDTGGACYQGTVTRHQISGKFKFDLTISVPAGVPLVLNVSPQEVSYSKSVLFDLRPCFDDGEPIRIEIAPGHVNAMIRKISDEYSDLASGLRVVRN